MSSRCSIPAALVVAFGAGAPLAMAQAWRPGLVGQGAVTLGYTDNVFSVADEATDPPHAGDWFLRLRAGVAAHFVGKHQYSLLEYTGEGERYFEHASELLWTHRFSGVIHRETSRRSTLDLAAGYERGRAHAFTGAAGRRDQSLATRTGEYAFTLMRGSERVDYEVTDLMRAFERAWAQRFDTRDTQDNHINGFELGGQVGLEREWRSTTGYVTAGPRYVSFTQLGGPERRRDLLLDFNLRAVRDLVRWGPAWAASADLGATLAKPLTSINPDERAVLQPTAMAQLTYAPANAGMAMFMVRRSIVPSFEAGASTISDRAMVVGNHPLLWNQLEQRARLLLEGSAGWERSRTLAEEASTRFTVRFVETAATYLPRVGVSVSLRYSYIDQRVRQDGATDILSQLGDYERHTVMLVVAGMVPGRGPRDAHVTGLGYSPSGDQTLPRSVLSSSLGGSGADGRGP